VPTDVPTDKDTAMTKEAHEPDPGQDDAFIGEGPAGDANPGDYMSNDQQGGVSEDTGTAYDQSGEPEETPNDEELRGEGTIEEDAPRDE
jgi:hypothetical protein